MNSTELSAEFQSAVVWAHHVCSAISFVICSFVSALIVLDKDSRAKAYRKYLFGMQLSSLAADMFMSTYSPFVQLNCCIMYGDSALSGYIEVATSQIIYNALFLEVVFAYFTCVYYRRIKLISPEARFQFHGWKQAVLLAAIQACLILVDIAMYFIVTELQSSNAVIPPYISWVKLKRTVFVLSSDRMNYPLIIFAIASALGFATIICAMITRLIREIKHGMAKASPATRVYQTRAVYSLVMQGTVPTIFFAVPTFSLLSVYIFMRVAGEEEGARSRIASTISVLAINVMTLHSFAHSLTILACSPSYRRTTLALFGKLTKMIASNDTSQSQAQ